jgi:hypothetical protein
MLLRTGQQAPAGLRHPDFRAVPLGLAGAELDYLAYMASPDVIRVHSGGRWPVAGFSREQDRAEIAVHEAEHAAGVAFTFSLLDPERDEAVGCLYLMPLQRYLERAGAREATMAWFPAASVLVTFWIRQDRQQTPLPRVVAAAVHGWITAEWPVDAHVFRIRPAEETSAAAIAQAGLRPVQVPLPGEHAEYLWYAPA